MDSQERPWIGKGDHEGKRLLYIKLENLGLSPSRLNGGGRGLRVMCGQLRSRHVPLRQRDGNASTAAVFAGAKSKSQANHANDHRLSCVSTALC
jgi:hypothetical protein